MNWMQFVSSLIGHVISWPAAVFALVVIFRRSLAGLIGELSEWEGFGQKARFGRQLAKAEAKVDAADAQVEVAGGAQSLAPVDWDIDSTLEPTSAVIRSWERLSGAIDDLVGTARQVGLIPIPTGGQTFRYSATQSLDLLARKEKIPPAVVEAIKELRELRNRVAHGQHQPTIGEALTYVQTAAELARVIGIVTAQVGH